MAMTYMLLALAILFEVAGTLGLKASEGFTRLTPSVIVVVGYSVSFVLLSLVLQRGMDVAVAYSIWSALGILAIAVTGAVMFGEHLSMAQVFGIALLIAGVVTLELGGKVAA